MSYRRMLLLCGVLASLLYAAMLIFIPLLWEEYSSVSQPVSELSAFGAPTRPLWFRLGVVYTLLVAALGWGVWLSAGSNRWLRIVGGLLIALGLIGLLWPPMHPRGTEFTLTDALHIVVTMMSLLLMVAAIGFAAVPLGETFRRYCVATLVIFVLFGILTGVEAPRVAANLSTPWIGVWERINIAAFLLWIAVLAIVLLRKERNAGGSD